MPAGRRAIYAWTTELWSRLQTLHKEAGNPGSELPTCPCAHTGWKVSRGVLLGLTSPLPSCRGLALYNEKEELKSQVFWQWYLGIPSRIYSLYSCCPAQPKAGLLGNWACPPPGPLGGRQRMPWGGGGRCLFRDH